MDSPQNLENVDIYEFLGISSAASDAEIRKAGRKTSLLYHPDKVAPTPENLANFHLVQQILTVLSDPTEKSKYDQTREAKLRRKAEVEALDARRRKMREDLETREKNGVNGTNGGLGDPGGQKRTFSQRDLDIRRIQEQNRAKMAAAAAKKRAEAVIIPEVSEPQEQNGTTADQPKEASSEQTKQREEDPVQNVRLRWVREGPGAEYDESTIQRLLNERGYGHGIESVVLLRDKKRKIDGKKIMMGTAVVIFDDPASASKLLKDQGKLIEFESVESMNAGSKDTET